MKKRIHEILTVSERKGDVSWWFDMFVIALISANVIAVVVESVEPIRLRYETFFHWFEIVSVVFFTVEYLLRLWTANEEKDFRRPVVGNFRYALTPFAVIDLLAILPFYLPFFGIDLRFIRMIRLLRLFRLLKVVRYFKALQVIVDVFKEKRESSTSLLFLLSFCCCLPPPSCTTSKVPHNPNIFPAFPKPCGGA